MIAWLHDWNHTINPDESLLIFGWVASITMLGFGFILFIPYIGYYYSVKKKYSALIGVIWLLMPVSVYVTGSLLGRTVNEDHSNTGFFAIATLLINAGIAIGATIFHSKLKAADKLYEKYNEIKFCTSCEVYSREGHIKLYQSTGQTGCPVCGEGKIIEQEDLKINHNLPLSPELNFTQCLELSELLESKKSDDFTSDQAEKYIRAQEEKIRRMKGRHHNED